MAFNADGMLDAGIHRMTVAELEDEFVKPFSSSVTRRGIYDGYIRHFGELETLFDEFSQLLDGSFVTNKNDPGDIDIVCVLPAVIVNSFDPAAQAKLQPLISGKATKVTHSCDAYAISSYPDTDPNYADYRQVRKYWLGEFGYDRMERAKGIVEVKKESTPTIVSSGP